MKKRFIAALTVLILLVSVVMVFSLAAAPYFTAVNNTLLPFSKSTMPFYSGGVLYVPSTVFSEFGIYSSSSVELGKVHLYKGQKYVDFYEFENKSVDQDGREREGVSARMQNGIFYLPLGVVCSYFDLQYKFISYDPIPILQIMSPEMVNTDRLLNDKSFIGVNIEKLKRFTNMYYGEDATQPPESNQTPTESVSPPPTYEDVTVYLSFYNISSGYTIRILDILTAPGYRCCFFVSADDIRANPGLIRRISGSVHSIGIWLTSGEYSEYLETSRLLFEAAKVKTVLVSSGGDAADAARAVAEENGLVFWAASRDYGGDTAVSNDTINGRFPTAPGASYNLRLECSDSMVNLLPGIVSHLRRNSYTVSKITETAEPI